jgi:hypothetical protein
MSKNAVAFLCPHSHFFFGFTAVELLMFDALRSDGEESYSFLYILPDERRKENNRRLYLIIKCTLTVISC